MTLDLFDTPIVRTGDPATSKAAAKLVQPKRGTHASQLLAIFKVYPRGLTPKEAAKYAALDGAWKRVSDLKNAGLIRGTGEVRDGGEVYVAVEP